VRGNASSLEQASFELIASRPARAMDGEPQIGSKVHVKLGFTYGLFKAAGLEIVVPE
jgi:hypothetical protein